MKQLFLTSSVNFVAYDIAQKVDLSLGNKLVFITTPVEPERGDKTWLKNDRQALVDAGFNVEDYTITNKTSEELKKVMDKFDYIYMSGGNTLYLLKESQKSGFIPIIRDMIENRGKTYIGTSAGSIIAGSKCPDYLLSDKETKEMKDIEGYNLVNFTIMPHWGSEHFREKYLKGRLEIAYDNEKVPFILLNDHQYIHAVNSTFRIIDVT